jgi:hypothetical protein
MSNTLAYFNTELITTVKIYFVSLKIACIYYTRVIVTNTLAYYGNEIITAILCVFVSLKIACKY